MNRQLERRYYNITMKYFLSSLVLLLSPLCSANVGVFTGFGHSIELTKSEAIQMKSEQITIIPGRGRIPL